MSTKAVITSWTAMAAGLALTALFGSCGDSDGDGSGSDAGGTDNPVTYGNDIAPILETHCTGCHSSGLSGSDRNGAPPGVDFNSYAAATTSAHEANGRIQAGTMPPGGELSPSQKSKFLAWIEQGLPE